MKRVIKKIVAVLLVLALLVPSFAFTAFADEAEMDEMCKKGVAALLTKGMGEIPVVGDFASDAFKKLLPDILGIESDTDKIMAKLDEIKAQLDKIELSIDKNSQDILAAVYQSDFNKFNETATGLRETEKNFFSAYESIQKSYNSSKGKKLSPDGKTDYAEYERCLAISNLAPDVSLTNTGTVFAMTTTLSEYVKGTQVSMSAQDGMLIRALMAYSQKDTLGGEAALAAKEYVSEVGELLEKAYSMIFIIMAAKIEIAQNLGEIKTLVGDGTLAPVDLTKYSYVLDSWKSMLYNESTGFRARYNQIFDEESSTSAISRYNAMVKKWWYCYIRDVRYGAGTINVDYVELQPSFVPYLPNNINGMNVKGIKPSGENALAVELNSIDRNAKAMTYGALTETEWNNLIKRMMNTDIFKVEGKSDPTLLDVLDSYGFSTKNYQDVTAFLKKWGGREKVNTLVLTGASQSGDKGEHNSTNDYYKYDLYFKGLDPTKPLSQMKEEKAKFAGYERTRGCSSKMKFISSDIDYDFCFACFVTKEHYEELTKQGGTASNINYAHSPYVLGVCAFALVAAGAVTAVVVTKKKKAKKSAE